MTPPLYAESSAVLEWLLDQPAAASVHSLLSRSATVVTSELCLVECERSLHRLVGAGRITPTQAQVRRERLVSTASGWILMTLNPSDASRASSCLPIWPNCGVGSTLAVLICNEQTPLLRALPPCIWTIWEGNPSARDASDGLKPEILERAKASFPVEPVRSLDALHLASAAQARSMVSGLALLSLDARIRANAPHFGLTSLP